MSTAEAAPPPTYVIKKAVLNKVPELSISAERFEELVVAREGISETLGMEEKFNLLLENYVEFEDCLLHSTVEMVVFIPLDWDDFIEHRHEFNRRTLNLLSAGRLLLDQLRHHMSSLFGSDSAERERLEESIRSAKQDHLGFRAVEALRNYVQHRDLPIQGFSQPNWRTGVDAEAERRATVTPLVSLTKLSEDRKFSKRILAELQEVGRDSIDLKPLIREWVACLAGIHAVARELVGESIQQWDSAVNAAINEYKRNHGEDVLGLAAGVQDERGVWTRKVWLGSAPSERRQRLVHRTRRVHSLGKVDVTSASKPPDRK